MATPNGLHAANLHERIDAIAADLKSTADRFTTAAAAFKDRASEAGAHARSGVSSLAARAGKAIQEHPIAAIGIAFGAGYLLMRWIRR